MICLYFRQHLSVTETALSMSRDLTPGGTIHHTRLRSVKW